MGTPGHMQSLRLGRDDQHDYVFGNIVIADGGMLELDGNPKLGAGQGWPAVIHADSINVHSGGMISADSLGFIGAHASGPGYDGNKGATHGGRGGNDNRKPTYGSFTNCMNLGSGASSIGGGAICLVSAGKLVVNGILSANAGWTTGTTYGGSGGSVNLIAPDLAGAGIIRANGASSTSYSGGGGGRISFVQVATNRFAGLIEVLPGESHRNYASAYAGTIAFPEGADLVLGGEGNMQTLRLGSDDDNNYVFGDIVIHEGGLLEIDGNPMRETFFGGAASVSATAINIHTGGLIRATAFGFGSSRAAPSNVVHSVGGAHGGAGGGAPLTYGSVVSPRNLGSGGGGTSTSGARNGGGAIILKAVETLNIDGAIACCGSDAVGAQGSGAGGTVNLEAGQLSGGGTIRADAGAATRNGGGGGRIALRAATSTFAGTCSALGGAGSASYNGPGAAGTVYTDLNGVKRLLVDNDKVIEAKPTYTWLPALTNAPAGELGDVALTVANLGRVALTNSIVVGDLHLQGEITSLFLNGHTLTVNSFYHRDWGDDALVDYAGGAIVWKHMGTIIMIR
ncbi:MAG: hypothetical protein GX590_12800 [Lentisphaerae bacterium]|nr:hypothetical protein [Lentisphaerota bacterium]